MSDILTKIEAYNPAEIGVANHARPLADLDAQATYAPSLEGITHPPVTSSLRASLC